MEAPKKQKPSLRMSESAFQLLEILREAPSRSWSVSKLFKAARRTNHFSSCPDRKSQNAALLDALKELENTQTVERIQSFGSDREHELRERIVLADSHMYMSFEDITGFEYEGGNNGEAVT